MSEENEEGKNVYEMTHEEVCEALAEVMCEVEAETKEPADTEPAFVPRWLLQVLLANACEKDNAEATEYLAALMIQYQLTMPGIDTIRH